MKRQPRDHFVDANKMIDVRHRPPQWVTPRWGMGGALRPQGGALGYRVDAPLARKIFCTKGAKPHSPGQRPGNSPPPQLFSPNGEKPIARHVWVTPRWGLKYFVAFRTRGDAPGYRVDAPLARKIFCTKGAKPHSLGQRPRFNAPPFIPSPERAKPNTEARQ